ncbi:hypothetical protein BJ741DRAFT_593718 [Chytriomyces cf. hyalinus JEL632]|nr:hypothetical protein BJ741DRAFT_593718 [Chytriomyces cf. hyalinus JEL632]
MSTRLTASRILELTQLACLETDSPPQTDPRPIMTRSKSAAKLTAKSLNTSSQPNSSQTIEFTSENAAKLELTDVHLSEPGSQAQRQNNLNHLEKYAHQAQPAKAGVASAAEPQMNQNGRPGPDKPAAQLPSIAFAQLLSAQSRSFDLSHLNGVEIEGNLALEKPSTVKKAPTPNKHQPKSITDLILQINQALNDASSSCLSEKPKELDLPSAAEITQSTPEPAKPAATRANNASDHIHPFRKTDCILSDWLISFDDDEVMASFKNLGKSELNVDMLVFLINEGIMNKEGSLVRTAKLLVALLRSSSVFVQDVFESLEEVIEGFSDTADMHSDIFRNFGILYGTLMVSDESSFDLSLLKELLDSYIQHGYRGELVVLHVLGQVFNVIRILDPHLSVQRFVEKQEVRLRAFWPQSKSKRDVRQWLEDHFLDELENDY